MKKFLLVIFIVILTGWKIHDKIENQQNNSPVMQPKIHPRCDGRRFCFQMTSCDEAVFFSRHCPNVIMDLDKDGLPCETTLCRH